MAKRQASNIHRINTQLTFAQSNDNGAKI